jgi:flagellar L-ring protein precursor FlgH
MKKLFSLAVFVLICAGMTACTTVPESIVHQPMSSRPQQSAAVPPANGTIFHTSAYRPMFEDRRARLAGDIITIVINEKTSAGKSTGNSGSKTGSTSSSVTRLFGVPAATLGNIGASGATANKFEEKDAASSSNNFSGTMAVTVIDVLQNGNLMVSGEKQIAFDKGIEYVRFSGIVSPDTIASGNIVSSTQVADARVEYRTNSRIDKAEIMSQLARFFFSFAPL